MDCNDRYNKVQRFKGSLRKRETLLHNPGDKMNCVPWIRLMLESSSTNIIPGRYEKLIDYNDNEHFLFPFRLF